MRSIYIIHFAMLIFSLGFSIILTGVFPYLRQVNYFILKVFLLLVKFLFEDLNAMADREEQILNRALF